MPRDCIYLDHNSTSPLDPRVLDAMLPFLREGLGNAASSHVLGRRARDAVERARAQVAARIGAQPAEVVWTSGTSESCNLALKCAGRARADRGRHVITQASEHPAVLDSCAALRQEGFDISVLPVDRDGLIDPADLQSAIRPDTTLVSVMVANNETGALLPVESIGALCRDREILFHADAAQALGRIPVDVRRLPADLLSGSAHKMHGPLGAGLLFVRGGRALLRGQALIHGGGHEQGLRSGTLNVPAIVGFGAAAALAAREQTGEAARLAGLRDELQAALLSGLPGVTLNGPADKRLPNTLNVSFAGVDAGVLLERLPHIAASSGAACTSARPGPSHVLAAMGRAPAELYGAVRFSLGRFNTADEIRCAAEDMVSEVRRLREC
jgi:cysteine desulfurase